MQYYIIISSIKDNNIMEQSKDPLHGIRLDTILEELVEYYEGFEGLGEQININCFTSNPSINSSLKFLRKTPWARAKVESLYLYVLRQKQKGL
ncbi:VF530 family protein [Edaphocola aurantiacus]|nr:VF530 family protein [Edaphocola aurantiacus]